MTNSVDFKEQIKLLVELQGLDSHIFKFEDELESIPVKVKSLEDAHAAKSANLKKLEEELKALQLKRKEKEVELETKEGSIKKYQTQLYQVKTNKEYTALQDEIGRVKADNSLIEEDIIKYLDLIDGKNKEMAGEKDLLKKEEASMQEEKKKLVDESVRLKSQIDELKVQRAQLAEKVDKQVLTKYERIIKKGDGLAVVSVEGESCQGCFRVMPAQVINEIKISSSLIFCENCARILYIAE
jgi:predicted  nucleic acid-binding Zn-ribbon protein